MGCRSPSIIAWASTRPVLSALSGAVGMTRFRPTVSGAASCALAPGHCLRRLLAKLRRVLARLVLRCRDPYPLGVKRAPLFSQVLLDADARGRDRRMPNLDKSLRDLGRQRWQRGFVIQTFGQMRPPLIEQAADPAGCRGPTPSAPAPPSARWRRQTRRFPGHRWQCPAPLQIRSDNKMLSAVIFRLLKCQSDERTQ